MSEYTSEEKKQWLQQYGNIDRKIKSLLEQKMELVESMVSIKSPQFDDMPHGSSKKTDLSDWVIKFERLCKAIDNKRTVLFKFKMEIETAVFNLADAKESEVIRRRYIQMQSWEKIAAEMGYEVRQIYRFHGNALNHIKVKCE